MCSRSLCGSEATSNPHHPALGGVCGVGVFHSVSVVIALGKRPVTFRTRKLSLSAPMVLQGGPCGRVGHRRTILEEGKPRLLSFVSGAGVFLFPVTSRSRRFGNLAFPTGGGVETCSRWQLPDDGTGSLRTRRPSRFATPWCNWGSV